MLHNPSPEQNPIPSILVVERGYILGRKTGLWSTEAKVWGNMPKAAWH
jgi:hypothetical protein